MMFGVDLEKVKELLEQSAAAMASMERFSEQLDTIILLLQELNERFAEQATPTTVVRRAR